VRFAARSLLIAEAWPEVTRIDFGFDRVTKAPVRAARTTSVLVTFLLERALLVLSAMMRPLLMWLPQVVRRGCDTTSAARSLVIVEPLEKLDQHAAGLQRARE
jgi:hypothetical protein